jgi:hypothetical protein
MSAIQLCSLIGRRLRERFVSAKHHLPFNLRRLRTTETVCRGQSMSCHFKPKYSLGRIPVATATASAGPCVSAPLKKADLLAIAHYLIGHLSYSQVPALAKRHKVEAKKDSASAHELLAKQVSTYGESDLCKLLLEISLLDSAYQRSTASPDDVLMNAAKRYRVDTEKLQKIVAEKFAAKHDKKTKAKSKIRKTAS